MGDRLKKAVHDAAHQMHDQLLAWRHHLHQHPELSFQEFETTRYIHNQLEQSGFELQPVPTETGAMIVLGEPDPNREALILRADIDALPIQEQNDTNYKSRREGVMHACGHDVHTTCMLGAAHILRTVQDQWPGQIKIVFQPAEEKSPGGARPMIEGGILERPKVSAAIGQHVAPDIPAGQIGFRSGLYMASTDEIHLTVHGRGGHAAMPDRLVDPVVIAAHLITQLQSLSSRQAPSTIPTVLSFGWVEAAGSNNVIPNEVRLSGTLRTFDETWRAEAKRRIERMTRGLVESMGGTVDLNIQEGYPALHNDEKLTHQCRDWAREFVAPERILDLDMRPTGEDFAYFGHHVPSTFYRLGVQKSGDAMRNLHTPRFDIDESVLPLGAGLMAYLAMRYMQHAV